MQRYVGCHNQFRRLQCQQIIIHDILFLTHPREREWSTTYSFEMASKSLASSLLLQRVLTLAKSSLWIPQQRRIVQEMKTKFQFTKPQDVPNVPEQPEHVQNGKFFTPWASTYPGDVVSFKNMWQMFKDFDRKAHREAQALAFTGVPPLPLDVPDWDAIHDESSNMSDGVRVTWYVEPCEILMM